MTASTQFQAQYAPAPAGRRRLCARDQQHDRGRAGGGRQSFAADATSTLATRRSAFLARGSGSEERVATFAPGQVVAIDIFRGAKRVVHGTVPTSAGRGKGVFSFSFKPRKRGIYHVRASVPGGSRTARVFVVRPHAGAGSRGTAVRALQSG